MNKILPFLLASIILYFTGYTQPAIISVIPSTLVRGQSANLLIKGENTHFMQSQTSVNLGQGIVIKSIQVSSPEILSAVIDIDANAPIGNRTLSIMTYGEKVEMVDAVEIIDAGTQLRAIISLMPVQALYLADFDPNQIKNAPLLFSIMIINDHNQQDLKSVLTISHDVYGEIVKAEKKHNGVSPNAVISFNNREFDEYRINTSADKLLRIASQTGMLPPGYYTYKIEIFSASGILLAEDEASDYLSNDISDIELIGPGESLDVSPEVIQTEYPYFQWFSQAVSFDFTLYEVMQGQKTKDEILSNVPVFQQKNISGNGFIYPNSAEKLIKNKAYAWQVKAYFNTAKGQKELYSDVFWFSIGGSDKGRLIIQRMEVEPEIINLTTEETRQFTAYGYDDKGEKLQLSASWKIIPSDGGSISSNGLFKAGKYPKPVAVLAEYEGLNAYATVNVLWNINNQIFDIGKLFDNVFGLPQK